MIDEFCLVSFDKWLLMNVVLFLLTSDDWLILSCFFWQVMIDEFCLVSFDKWWLMNFVLWQVMTGEFCLVTRWWLMNFILFLLTGDDWWILFCFFWQVMIDECCLVSFEHVMTDECCLVSFDVWWLKIVVLFHLTSDRWRTNFIIPAVATGVCKFFEITVSWK